MTGDRSGERVPDWLAADADATRASADATGATSGETMRACCWHDTNDLRVNDVPRPDVVNPRDVVLRVTATSACGSDLHFLHGYVPTMREGDVIGHEFMGEVAETGSAVDDLEAGDRVVVTADVGCGHCGYCQDDLWSLCDNSNPNPDVASAAMGHAPAAIFGYTHAFGGYAGSHAEFVRVPHAEVNCFQVPDELDDEQALFASDAWATGYMGADFCDVQDDDVVAVWGCGAVGLMAAHSASFMGAERVIAIDSVPERLRMAREHAGVETIDYTEIDSVVEELKRWTGGRGPDACIDAVGMEASGSGLLHAADRAKQAARLHTDRGQALRQALRACGKGGTLAMLGVYGVLDSVPLGLALNKGLTIKTAQLHGQRYVLQLLEHAAEGQFDPSYLATHEFSLDEAPEAYDVFEERADGMVRPVFRP